jgi:hypothetical protein
MFPTNDVLWGHQSAGSLWKVLGNEQSIRFVIASSISKLRVVAQCTVEAGFKKKNFVRSKSLEMFPQGFKIFKVHI